MLLSRNRETMQGAQVPLLIMSPLCPNPGRNQHPVIMVREKPPIVMDPGELVFCGLLRLLLVKNQ